jgi:NAD-dependent dihydropyrimidine dehydrogenase PreA subunit
MIGYRPKQKGIGLEDWFKDKIGATPKTWGLTAAVFRMMPTLAKLCKYPVVGSAFKWVRMFSPFDKRYTQGVALPLNIDLSDKAQKVTVPIDMMKETIRKSSYRLALNRCLCRDSHHCKNYSHEIACIFLGEAARMTEKHGLGREVTAEEACALVDRAAAAGLVGQALWVEVEQYVWGFENEKMENFLEFCFCCPCCCTALNVAKNSTPDVRRRFKSVGWQAQVSSACKLCGACLEVCPHHAITLGTSQAMISADCMGCGICTAKCSTKAISLELLQPLKPEVKDYFTGLRLNT